MYKKYVHSETNGELIVQDEVQEAALIQEGFKFKCDVERQQDGTFVEVVETTKKK